MPRRHARRPSSPAPAARARGSERVEQRAGTAWNVRDLRGSDKEYRCPGCHQAVRAGTDHVLVWPVEKSLLSAEAIDERRHWHTACWRRGLTAG